MADSSKPRTVPAMNALIEELRSAWSEFPKMRLCQLIVNATRRSDPFYVEDDDLAAALTVLRHEAQLDALTREPGGEHRQDRQIDVQLDAADSTGAEREE